MFLILYKECMSVSIKKGKVFKDAYGTKITSYMKLFSGYDIKLN